MGNVCLQSNQQERQKILKISGYSFANCPSKQILDPSVQNISLNLDTFEEDFFKNEFLLDYQTDFKRNQSTRKVKLGSTLEEINLLNSIQCPSLCHIDDRIELKPIIILKTIADQLPLNKNKGKFKLEKKKIQPEQKKKKTRKRSVQQNEKPRSILKLNYNTPNSSLSSLFDNKSSRTVTFSLASSKTKNSRSLSPLIMGMQFNMKQQQSKSMCLLQQFPYL